MNEKKAHIIDTAIGLFAEKGFHSTSIQEIADESGVSKGAVYIHFRSKEDVMLEIFWRYSKKMHERAFQIEQEDLSPEERFRKQIQVQFEEIANHKGFFIMQYREQTLPRNQDVDQFIRTIRYESHKWCEKSLLAIYGEKVRPYVNDGSFLLDSIRSSYVQLIMMNDCHIDRSGLASFIVRRLDDLIQGMLKAKESPILTKEVVRPIFKNVKSYDEKRKEEVMKYISEMQQILHTLTIEREKAEELQGSLDLLRTEIQKLRPKKFIFQGMLANFKEIGELNDLRRLIADRMDIQLL